MVLELKSGCIPTFANVCYETGEGLESYFDQRQQEKKREHCVPYSVTSDMKRFIDRCYSLIQFPGSRSEWIGKYDEAGKACVTAAVCEQVDEAHMGNTLTLLTDFARDIGLDVIASAKALNCFEAGSITKEKEALAEARSAGEHLLRLITPSS